MEQVHKQVSPGAKSRPARMYSICRLDLSTGEVKELYQRHGFFEHTGLAVSPKEDWLIFSEAPLQESELMLAENFR